MEFPGRIGRRITFYVSIILILVLAVGGLSIYLARSISTSTLAVTLENKHVEVTESIHATIHHFLAELNRVMIARKLDQVEDIQLFRQKLDEHIKAFLSLHNEVENAEELRIFRRIEAMVVPLGSLAERVVQRAAQGLPPSLEDEKELHALSRRIPVVSNELNDIHYGEIRFELLQSQQRMRTILWIYVVFILAGGVVLGLGNLFFSRRVAFPLRQLASATSKIAEGDFARRVPVTSADEIGLLSHAFNLMGERLQAQEVREKRFQEELEKTVKERTRELEEANRYLKETQDNLIELEKLKVVGEMHASLAHEINNPLGIIISKAKMIMAEGKEKGLPPEVLSDLEIMTRHASRIAQVIRSLLTFARRTPFKLKDLSLNEVIQETVALVEKPFARAGISIIRKFQPDLGFIKGDYNHLQQVFLNLLSNAKDALTDGGTITVETCRDGSCGPVIARVRDDGTGIAPKDLPRIFEPFFTTKEVGKGTGLGLSVSYGIIKAHNGDIKVESQLGKGASFTLMFKSGPGRGMRGEFE